MLKVQTQKQPVQEQNKKHQQYLQQIKHLKFKVQQQNQQNLLLQQILHQVKHQKIQKYHQLQQKPRQVKLHQVT